MAVTFVAAATLVAVAANPPTVNLTLPSGANLEADDIIIIPIMSKNIVESTNEITTPTNYTEKGTKAEMDSATAADDMRAGLFWKRAVGGDDGASVTISRAGTSTLLLAGVAYVFRGCATSGDPFDAAGVVTNIGDDVADTDIDFPAFDPAADRHVCYFAWHADDVTTTPTNLVNGGFTFTFRNEQETATGTDATAMLWSADHDGTALSAVTKSFTGTGGTSIGYVFALIPAATGTTVTPSPVVAKFVVPAPALANGAVTLTPSAVSAKFVIPAPTVSNAKTLTPAPVIARFAIATPTVVKGVRTLTPSPVLARFLIAAPTLVKGGVTKTPAPVVARFLVAPPTVVRGVRTLTPNAVVAKWLIPTPTVTNQAGDILTPAPVVARFIVATPSLLKGVRTLTPSPVQARFLVTTPSVLRGSVSVSLTPAVARWFVVTPIAFTVVPAELGRPPHGVLVTSAHGVGVSGTLGATVPTQAVGATVSGAPGAAVTSGGDARLT